MSYIYAFLWYYLSFFLLVKPLFSEIIIITFFFTLLNLKPPITLNVWNIYHEPPQMFAILHLLQWGICMCTIYRQGTSLLVLEAFWCLLAVSAFVNNNDKKKKKVLKWRLCQSSLRKICDHSSACFHGRSPSCLFFSTLPCFPRCQTQCWHHCSWPIIFLPTFSEPISLRSACFKSQCTCAILLFRLSFVQLTSSPSPPHLGDSEPHPSIHLNLHHQQHLDSRGSCPNS